MSPATTGALSSWRSSPSSPWATFNCNADIAARAIDAFLGDLDGVASPFARLRALNPAGGGLDLRTLGDDLRRASLCLYNQKAMAGLALAGLDLAACSPAELERIPWIGFRTSRFFVRHTRPGARVAVIDTHVARFLGIEVPKNAAAYRRVEARFLALADTRGMTPAALDLEV